MKKHLLLYSINTYLAYSINSNYYNDLHYVWCSPFFDCREEASRYRNNPQSSNPCEIYLNFSKDVERNDEHSLHIKQNKIGLLSGASQKRQQGLIDKSKEEDIIAMVNDAPLEWFRPLVYVIPKICVEGIYKQVENGRKANPLSAEYLVESLPGDCFDIIKFEGK